MSGRHNHVPIDRLTALAFTARAPMDAVLLDATAAAPDHDLEALDHISACDRCSRQFARLTVDADGMREAAFAEADAIFDDGMLEAQRMRILDRLAHIGQAARVLRFPARTREAVMPVSVGSRRWVSVAAAAGLIIGLLAGQMLHFVPGWDVATHRDTTALLQAPRTAGPVLMPAASPSLSDDELLAQITEAVVIKSAAFRTLDALTPLGSAGDFRDPMGR